ncbi:BnaC06g14250D [Brassica napus]|uniref:BnaC06g14250D protein n=1 Tax=Brassica napus TaxID=3708 RepID=A0A078FJZ7_BRANA|nr:BnaC06g14250D [Brassica napus]
MIGSSMQISLLQDGLFVSINNNQSGSAPISSWRQSPRSISPRGRSRSSRIRELCSPTPSSSPPKLFVRSGKGAGGFWNRGISACAVCDGTALIFRNKPLVVIGGGDSAMHEVYIIHRCDTFRASKIMQQRALSKPKIELIWNSVVVAYGDENGKGRLGGLKVKNVVVSGDVSDLKIYGLFFAIGHEPETKFLDGQFELDEDGYVVTKPGTTKTSVLLYVAVDFLLYKRIVYDLQDPPAPMPKDTNLDVIRVLVDVTIRFSYITKPESYLQDMV